MAQQPPSSSSSSSTTALIAWALPRLQLILPLDDDSLCQVLAYADSLSKDAAAEHLKNLLGDDDPRSLEFISGFNLRRPNKSTPTAADHGSSSTAACTTPESLSGPPSRSLRPNQKKKKPPIHTLPARQLEDLGSLAGAYQKANAEDYMSGNALRSRERHKTQVADNLALTQQQQQRPPDAMQMPLVTDSAALTTQPVTAKAPPSASGPLISDSLSAGKSSSAKSSRTASPTPKTKVNITGGTAMHGASTALSDLDSAIRSLEVQTNPTLSSSNSAADLAKRKCGCMATKHPLLDIAPNCLNCGKIICVKEGLAPCTFCGSQLLSSDDLQKVLRVLKEERGEERMKVNNAAHKRADVAVGKSRALTGRDFLAQASSSSHRTSPLSSTPATPTDSDNDEAGEKAKAHRDRLLGFQANNARRTRIHDEAADYDVPSSGTNMWASPAERAQQLKKQQEILREMEWNARPDYEKRKVVASIDLKGGKVVRRMAEVERPDFSSADEGVEYDGEDDSLTAASSRTAGDSGKGTFSHNPLAKGLIRPLAREGKAKVQGRDVAREKTNMWRRVQMDDDDNEQWILDGGVYGTVSSEDRTLGSEEHAVG